MALGLSVVNSTGNVVVDMTYQNLSLKVKQDFSLGAGGTTSVTATGCVAPMLCINASGYTGFYGATVSGSTYTWRIKAAEASSGTFYVFDQPHPAHTSSFGLKLLASDGVSEIFNSDNKYLRVAGILNIPWSASFSNQAFVYVVTGGTATNSSLPSAKYAVCASMSRVNSVSLGNNNFRRTFDGVKTTATSVSVAQTVNIDFFAGGGGEHPGVFAVGGSGTVPALIVNVEGF